MGRIKCGLIGGGVTLGLAFEVSKDYRQFSTSWLSSEDVGSQLLLQHRACDRAPHRDDSESHSQQPRPSKVFYVALDMGS